LWVELVLLQPQGEGIDAQHQRLTVVHHEADAAIRLLRRLYIDLLGNAINQQLTLIKQGVSRSGAGRYDAAIKVGNGLQIIVYDRNRTLQARVDFVLQAIQLTAKLAKTVREYNDACQGGDYNPAILDGVATRGLDVEKTNWALPINQPPYEAYVCTTGITFTFGGLQINTLGEVQDMTDQSIPGLYAAGELVGVVEDKDATPEQRAIAEINSGLLAAPHADFAHYLPQVQNENKQAEYYLPDILSLAVADGLAIVEAEVEEVSVGDVVDVLDWRDQPTRA